ncbi:hypothetical protein [Mesorhizobium sp. L48C026A00]|uniref:hypothetical protein n=1 Tax=Mesorhizobium sp. L48C026A00 TaxID=1287182 RepID=UPI0004209B03|nr:hypothetical protein [Mesorhizobium sp. L48C026A00]
MLDGDVSKSLDNLQIYVLTLVDEQVREAVCDEPTHQGTRVDQCWTDPKNVVMSEYAV